MWRLATKKTDIGAMLCNLSQGREGGQFVNYRRDESDILRRFASIIFR